MPERLADGVRSFDLAAGDGRTLRLYECGDPAGRPIFLHHGTPGCGLPFANAIAAARTLGVRLIAHDRPGFGGSTRLPGRTVTHVASDLADIADRLGIERFATIGGSGGGPHALACAALLPDRVVACVAAASVAPFAAEGLDWSAGMGGMNAEEVAIAERGAGAMHDHLQAQAAEFAAATPDQLREGLSSLLSPVDREALTGELAAHLHRTLLEALRQGVDGYTDETMAEYRPWGFEPSQIAVAVQVWHGGQDRFVPVAHGRWLAGQIPGAELHVLDGDGHISLLQGRLAAMLEWLAGRS